MRLLTIRWQRLVDENDRTCARCHKTGNAIETAFTKLKKSLSELDISVELKKEALDFSLFLKDPLQSNRIWIGGKPLEDLLGVSIGKSQCCEVCGNSNCRTLSTDKDIFEIIPENWIIRAGLIAAAELITK